MSSLSAHAENLWEKALTLMGNGQVKAMLETTVRTQKRDILSAVVQTIHGSEQSCIRNRLRFRDVNGSGVITCDLFQKMASPIEQLQQKSQNGVQSDTIDAFVPWAAIRYLLRKPIDDAQEYGVVISELAEQESLTIVITAIDSVEDADRHNLMEALKEIAVNAGNVAKMLVFCSDNISIFSTLARDHFEPHGLLSAQNEGDISFNAICFPGCIERKAEVETFAPEGNALGHESPAETTSGPEEIAIRLSQSEELFQTLADYELAVLKATDAGSMIGLQRFKHSKFHHQLFSEENKEKLTSMTRRSIQNGHTGVLD
ncbi:hypothetical protein CEP53_007730 [Fusarium sp. AF-6]|nr:hypothetical protein CEP53_007730 [Fusarium sp. AF-6]